MNILQSSCSGSFAIDETKQRIVIMIMESWEEVLFEGMRVNQKCVLEG